jgi:hypothetical protein
MCLDVKGLVSLCNLTAKIRQNYGGQSLLFEGISNSSWFFAELEGPLDEIRNKVHGEHL